MLPHRTIERDGMTLRKLSIRDKARLLAELKAERRAALAATLAATPGVDAATIANELHQADIWQPSDDDWIALVNSPMGRLKIFEAALRGQPNAEDLLDAIDDDLGLAAELCGLRITHAPASGTGSTDPMAAPTSAEDCYGSDPTLPPATPTPSQ
jgi:hypothetical protein